MTDAVLGVDIGTSSSKGVLVDLSGRILGSASREHTVSRPAPGHVEMDAEVWWDEFVAISRELLSDRAVEVRAVGVSGMGPCVLLTDADDVPLRPAILYGVDTRSGAQVAGLTDRYGDAEIRERCGSSLSSQAAGAKVAWVADEEPDVFARASRLYMPSSWLAQRLTGAYVLDQHSASQCTPLYDVDAVGWYEPWVDDICPDLELPELRWPGDVAGVVHARAAEQTGLRVGTPVITGTIDAWAEALSVDAHHVGDLMLMYGTTLFLINTVRDKVTHPSLWGTTGALPGTRSLAGGMATSGAITGWLRDLFGGTGYAELVRLAEASPPGSNGLLMLPYFAGERTPIMDPDARGAVVGLTLSHGRGDLYRAALEATAFGVRHNVETIRAAGGDVRRVVAVGGGTQGGLWTQVVSDVTGLTQVVPEQTVGASYGGALLAAQSVSDVSIRDWNPPRATVEPDPAHRVVYDDLYGRYRDLYTSTRDLAHALADLQKEHR
ncbi:FGGY-family carbohydrate kinase [Nocardioides sp. YIM 152315]|uniref:FGGY-family carbohydrate kinase n=1 Tax=Nocardioides sp. YIM 152315 TaxID=3031760 RepID=UPI0023D9D4C0|nr:FGGY-family carbohydrate kinase [Nocardioides sp. YIM 152315]MDF1603249.1 FGGY-family carbohydrate kinase [Nocardioides sp. YIM 152315]